MLIHVLIYVGIAVVSFGAGVFLAKQADSELVATETDLKDWAQKLEASFLKDKTTLAADVSAVVTSIKSKL